MEPHIHHNFGLCYMCEKAGGHMIVQSDMKGLK